MALRAVLLRTGRRSVGLEDRFRPHFFGGVATVVGKLFTQCRPDVAIFGEKDFQQLRVVARMAADLDLGVKVIGSKTVRERDGLAMSSRNVYLSAEERRAAPILFKAMKETARRLRAGEDLQTAQAAPSKPSPPRVCGRLFRDEARRNAGAGHLDQGWAAAHSGRRQNRHDPADRQYRGVNEPGGPDLEQPEIAQFAAHRLGHGGNT